MCLVQFTDNLQWSLPVLADKAEGSVGFLPVSSVFCCFSVCDLGDTQQPGTTVSQHTYRNSPVRPLQFLQKCLVLFAELSTDWLFQNNNLPVF